MTSEAPHIIIFAAGKISNKFRFLQAYSECPALIPVHSKPLAYYSVDFFQRVYPQANIYLVIDQEFEIEVASELRAFQQLNIVPIAHQKGVIHSIQAFFDQVKLTGNCIVSLVTTIPTEAIALNEVFISKNKQSNVAWSLINFNSGNSPIFNSKNQGKNTSGYAFTGVFYINIASLLRALHQVEEYNDLMLVIAVLAQAETLSYKKVDWIDVGHEINYYEAKSNLISSRSFNTVNVLSQKGIIVKSSANKVKIREERNFILSLPDKLKILFPRILNDVDHSKEGYAMEYYGYPNLSELQLYWSVAENLWERIFLHIEETFKQFIAFPSSIGPKAHQAFYWTKTIDRIAAYKEQLSQNGVLPYWMTNEIRVDDVVCKPFDALAAAIQNRIAAIYCEDHFCVMHGDFCFNNVLYDLASGIIRLIDPRGSFGKNVIGIYGDIKYDLAKLTHSTIGNYDYLVNHLFQIVESEKGQYTIQYNLRKNSQVLQVGTEQLIQRLGFNLQDIMFITGLLFVSMTPLHDDSQERQKAMYLTGIKLLNKFS